MHVPRGIRHATAKLLCISAAPIRRGESLAIHSGLKRWGKTAPLIPHGAKENSPSPESVTGAKVERRSVARSFRLRFLYNKDQRRTFRRPLLLAQEEELDVPSWHVHSAVIKVVVVVVGLIS